MEFIEITENGKAAKSIYDLTDMIKEVMSSTAEPYANAGLDMMFGKSTTRNVRKVVAKATPAATKRKAAARRVATKPTTRKTLQRVAKR